jgi:hypothetical protein
MNAILPIVSAFAGLALGVIGTSMIYLPKVNLQEDIIDGLLDELSEVEIENDLLHAERKRRPVHV